MSTEKNSLRARAANLFAAEERNQELVGLALLQQCSSYQTVETVGNPPEKNRGFAELVMESDESLLAIHYQLQHAKNCAAHLQAKDDQLQTLNQLIYGGCQSQTIDKDIIDGEVIDDESEIKPTD